MFLIGFDWIWIKNPHFLWLAMSKNPEEYEDYYKFGAREQVSCATSFLLYKGIILVKYLTNTIITV